VGEVDAEITSISDTSITVTVPQRAVDGTAVVIKDQQYSNTLPLTIAGGTAGPPAGFAYTAPDSASLVPKGLGSIFFDRIVVSFTGSTSDTAASAVLDDAVVAIGALIGWTQVELSPSTNTWQVALTWDATATVSDWDALADHLLTDTSVDDVSAEMPVHANADGFGPGQDVTTSWTGVQQLTAAYDMVAIEEAWRLFAATSPTLVPGVSDVVVIDSGLLPAETSGTVTRHPIDDTHFSMYGVPSSGHGWTKQDIGAWFDGYESCAFANESHGSFVAGIIGAANEGEPRWDGGSDQGPAAMGVSGVLGGLQQWGVDDDGDGTVDERGESIDYSVSLFGVYSVGGGSVSSAGECLMSTYNVIDTLRYVSAKQWRPDVINLSVSHDAVGDDDIPDDVVTSLSDDVLVTAAAGNTTNPSQSAYGVSQLAEQVDRHLTNLVVGGTDPNPGASQADSRADWTTPIGTIWYSARSGIGGEIDIAAPAQVLGVRATSSTSATFGRTWGTSNATPLVSGVAAMLKAADPDLHGPDLAGIIQGTATPITGLWSPPEAMSRLDATAALAFVLSRNGTLDQDVRVYAGDYSAQRIWFQTYDLATRQFIGSADSYDAAGECSPVDVEVDARGDLIYALCRNGGSPASLLVLAHGQLGELAKVGQYTLPGAVDTYTELVTTPEGYVVVATDASTGSGAGSYTVLDGFDGSVVAVDDPLFASGVVELEGAAAHATGQQVYFTANDNDGTVGGDQLAIVDMDAYRRAVGGLTVTSGDYASAFNPVQVRDVGFDPIDDLPISLFYHSISDSELVWNDTDGSFITDDELNTIDNGNTLSLNPSGEDRLGYVGSIDPGTPWFSMVDVTDSPWTPLAVIAPPGTVSSPSAAFSDFSDTGRTVVLGWRGSGSGVRVYVVPHDALLSSTTSAPTNVTDITDYDAMSVSFSSLRGVAMTPSISVLSPRPGKELSGVRRMIIQVRDPDIDYLSFLVDGAPVPTCPDDAGLTDGISDACLLQASGWSSPSDHTVEITAHFSDGTTASSRVRY